MLLVGTYGFSNIPDIKCLRLVFLCWLNQGEYDGLICSKHSGGENRIQYFDWKTTMEETTWETYVDGGIILKVTVGKLGVKGWCGLCWLRIESNSGSSWAR
jgi:hypothetical protein